ncbi:large ribosomal subunit protein mL37 [Musca vetustissima]|uniref:large ribosomal subunit protein mL37 n=1 Tax=Musca vetustissima TaxID=27455 RepID=UPI002AB659FA|nr:large ribosomal subunit protein mL37 [Musca vetustissima]
MRFTNRLFAQHLGWTFKKHWQTQGKRIPNDTGAVSDLEKVGILVKSPSDVITVRESNLASVERHEQRCYMYANHNVLLEGLLQAQVLTNTVKIHGLPKPLQELIDNIKIPSSVERNVEQAVLNSDIYDAEQTLLSRKQNPNRPGYKYPRTYGQSQLRRNRVLLNKLLNECEKLSSADVSTNRRIIDDAVYKVTLPINECLLQMNITANKIITTQKPIEPLKGRFESELPELYPTKSTISLPHGNCYTLETKCPLSNGKYSNPHTVITFFDKENLRNVHGTTTTGSQFQSRTLLSAFAVAATRAKQLYGDTNIEKIPKPIVIQSVQTDGRTFHFGVFQLNTLIIDGKTDSKNYWFQEENIDLYKHCSYINGQPRLDGCDNNVIRNLAAFYNNI